MNTEYSHICLDVYIVIVYVDSILYQRLTSKLLRSIHELEQLL